eukprot:g29407.t1
MHTKIKKFKKLGITTSNNQASPVPWKHVSARFINHTHKVAQNVTQAQHDAIQALKTNHNIVIKPADKRGAIVKQNRTDYCKEVYQQLNNQ